MLFGSRYQTPMTMRSVRCMEHSVAPATVVDRADKACSALSIFSVAAVVFAIVHLEKFFKWANQVVIFAYPS